MSHSKYKPPAQHDKTEAPPARQQEGKETSASQPFFQPKAVIAPAKDAAEHEADRVADAVQQGTNVPTIAAKPPTKGKAQRMPNEEEPTQRMPQTEEQPEQVAEEHVQRMIQEPEGVAQRMATEEQPTAIQSKKQEEETPQSKSKSAPKAAPNGFSQQVRQAKSGGQIMDTGTRTRMEQSIGADFSQVRIHTGSKAEQLNNQINAKAFTTGKDIFFNKGQYQPKQQGGQHLLAHELTHVVQQKATRQNTVQRNPKDKKKQQQQFDTLSKGSDLVKNTADQVSDSSKHVQNAKGAARGANFLAEYANRRAKGQSKTQALMGGLQKVGLDVFTGGDLFKKAIGGKAPNAKIGWLVAGMKMMGYNEAADIIDVASKLSRQGLVGQGIIEGFTGGFDLIYNSITQGEKGLEKQRQGQLKGDYGPITQGYSMLAALVVGISLNDFSEMYKLSDLASQGKLGTLAKVGDRLGAGTHDAVTRLQETYKNRSTDDALRATPTTIFAKMSVYEKSEAIHHLITGYTGKKDIDTIKRIMSTVNSRKDRHYIAKEYDQKTYSLGIGDRITIEMAIDYRDYKDERSGKKKGYFPFTFALSNILESRRFFVGNGKLTLDVEATSTKGNEYTIQVYRDKAWDIDPKYSKVNFKANGDTLTYTWTGLPMGRFYFVVRTSSRIVGNGKANLHH